MASITPALAETLVVLEDAAEPLSTSEVADALGVGRRSTYDRLDRLRDGGHVRTKAVGASARIWWVEDGRTAAGAGRDDEPTGRDAAASAPEDPSLRAAVDAATIGVAVFDADDDLAFASAAFRAHLGLGDDATTEALADVAVAVGGGDPVARPVESLWTDVREERRRIVVEHADRWLSVGVRGTDAGGTVATTMDVTRRVDWEAELADESTVVERELAAFRERAVDGFATVDEDGYVVDVDARFARHVCGDGDDGSHATALLDQHVDTAFDATPAAARTVLDCLDGDAATSVETPAANGDRRFEVEAVPIEHGAAVFLRDVTDRVARERDRRRYASLVDALGEPVYELDEAGYFTFVNDAAVAASGYSREELLGSHVSIGMPDDAIQAVSERLVDALGDGDAEALRAEYEVEPKDGEPFPVENRLAVLTDDEGHMTGTAGILRDISDRWERERELETYERIVETVEDGIYVLDAENRFLLANEAFASLVDATVDELVGAKASVVLTDEFVERGERALAATTDADEGTAGDATDEAGRDAGGDRGRFQQALETATGETFVADVQVSAFGFEDGCGRVGVVRDVTDRVERERQIEEQRSRLEALNEMNALVRDVATAAVEGSTREAIESLVCEELAAASSYAFAWIGEVDAYDGTISLRTEAGVDGYLADATISTARSDPLGRGPVGRAVRERTVQTVQDAASDPGFEPLGDLAARHGFASVAAVPITYEGALYGVLSVHADRENAFTGEERAAVERIGEFVGHAIAAVDRKRALTSEEVVELDYRVAGIYDDLDVDVDPGGRIAFEDTVRVDDEEHLVYGTVTDDAREALEALVAAFDGWESVSFVDSTAGPGLTRFELRTKNALPYLEAMGSGGYIERATIEDGESRVVMHVPPETDVRAVTTAVRESYPGAELVSKRQFSRPSESMYELQRQVEESLTERQRSVLEAAFYAGFFEWPRAVSGKEVASSLDIAPPTFSQHIRRAERTVFSLLLESDRRADDDEHVPRDSS